MLNGRARATGLPGEARLGWVGERVHFVLYRKKDWPERTRNGVSRRGTSEVKIRRGAPTYLGYQNILFLEWIGMP